MGVRNGQQFIDGLKANPREVWINGERIEDVTTHPAFSRIVRQLARLYDAQVDPATRDTLTYEVPETGQRAGMAFMPAKTAEDLRRRRDAFYHWASMNFGLMGRSPDFLNVSLLAFAEAREVFGRGGQRYADNIVNYYEYVRDNDLFLSHALITPQNDRTKSSAEQKNLHMRVVKETDSGIYVQGARMVATLGAVADEMLMYCLPGIPESDADHALSFAVKVSDPGVRQICREPYTLDGQRSDFDHPLSNNFEENDSLLIFDNVFVPWERVFMYRDVALNNALYTETALRNYTAHQTNTRALVKMQFAVGVAMAVARSIGADKFLHVQRMLGEALNGVVPQERSGAFGGGMRAHVIRHRAARAAAASGASHLPSDSLSEGGGNHPDRGCRRVHDDALGRGFHCARTFRGHQPLLQGCRRDVFARPGTAVQARLGSFRRGVRHPAASVRALLCRRPGSDHRFELPPGAGRRDDAAGERGAGAGRRSRARTQASF
ncbi:4-hydroxyphenylacetate 3-hydroxylase N-terminal domain-containing protein [Hoeflea sp.]|uniref:4-hydroxyphenylacetate 3-hydroxylase family protein n=1 Tax=Hoeflea sp. TaxID=1940281 RepID=UPI0025C2BD9D|nr:4-hydroxyphenylacetate 3-hydroxylase N-terminal domain-containing protein [Hoeflea sp.]